MVVEIHCLLKISSRISQLGLHPSLLFHNAIPILNHLLVFLLHSSRRILASTHFLNSIRDLLPLLCLKPFLDLLFLLQKTRFLSRLARDVHHLENAEYSHPQHQKQQNSPSCGHSGHEEYCSQSASP